MNRDVRTRLGATAALTAALAVATGPAQAQAQGMPAPVTVAESTFDADLEGWEASDGSCVFLGQFDVPAPLCAVGSSWNAEAKAAEATFEPLVNAGEAVVGRTTLRSPVFTVPAGQEVGSATLSVDRRATIDALLDAGGRAQWSVALVEDAEGAVPVELVADELTAGDDTWATRTVKVDGARVVPGRRYRILTTSEFTTQTAQAIQGTSAVAVDNVALSVLPPLEGPKGDQGATGQDGAKGDDGAQGDDGARGDAGAQGSAGETGSAGAAGSAGTAGPAGTPGVVRTVVESREAAPRVNSLEARRLLRVDRLVPVRFSGPFANQLRLRVLCRTTVLSRCEGTVKIRSVRPINVALQKGRTRMKRVTLGTGTYQLARRQLGYAKVFLTPQAQRLVRARAPLAVTVQVTVLDQRGRQQRLQRTFRVTL